MEQQLTVRTTDAMEVSLPIAGVGGRSLAFIIDWHIRALLATAWLFAATQVIEFVDEVGITVSFQDATTLVTFLVIVPPLAIYFLYHPVLEVLMHGRTPGKRMAGVRVVTLEGHTPGLGPLLVRNIFRLIDSLPMFYVVGLTATLLTPRQVRLGDVAGGTLLVYEKAPSKGRFEDISLQGLGQEQLELAQELLERWRSLGRATRDRLAQRILSREGVSVTRGLKGRRLDKALQQRLRHLVSGR